MFQTYQAVLPCPTHLISSHFICTCIIYNFSLLRRQLAARTINISEPITIPSDLVWEGENNQLNINRLAAQRLHHLPCCDSARCLPRYPTLPTYRRNTLSTHTPTHPDTQSLILIHLDTQTSFSCPFKSGTYGVGNNCLSSTQVCSTLLSSTLLYSTLLYSTLLYSTLLYSLLSLSCF